MSLNYNFEQLNPREFEELVTDLFREKLNTSVERFKDGKDLGVDSRFFDSSDGEGIIQCKHYIKSGVNKLISDLEKKELPKIQALQPTRYIVATTSPLSRTNKQEIKRKLSPFILSETDIFGQEDLNDLLKEYPKIERAHYKLWLTSTNVLHTLLNNALLGRSKDHLQNTISKQSKFLVQTGHYPKALQMIQERNTIIITGSPGVGKTTLANQLSLYLANEGYDFYYIDEDIKEAEDIFQEGKKQLFYFDDFLGSNILEALNPNNRDSKILKFIERINNNPDKKFILTSRAHILSQKISQNERYDHANINKDRYELEITQLSDLDKAKILYNHIWHSNLPEEYIDSIYLEERYKKIIEHQNYNPRIIEFVCNYERIQHIQSSEYWLYLQNTLDNPKDIWKYVIENDIDVTAKYLLLAITLNKNQITDSELQDFYSLLLVAHPELNKHKNFKSIVEPLLDSLLKSTINHSQNKSYSLFDPSIADYFLSNYLSDFSYLQNIYQCLKTNNSSYYLRDLANSNEIKLEHYKLLITNELIQLAQHNIALTDRVIDYLIVHLPHIDLNNQMINLYLQSAGNALLKKLDRYMDHLPLINYLTEYQIINIIDQMPDFYKLVEYYLNTQFEYHDSIALSKIINVLPDNKDKQDKIDLFKQILIENIDSLTLTDWAKGDKVLSQTSNYDNYSDQLVEWLDNDLFSDIPFHFSDDELSILVDHIDIGALLFDEYEDEFYHSRHVQHPSSYMNINPISDLFHRD